MTPARRPVTIVVPTFGDTDSVSRCIRSLLRHVDTKIDSVLIVDDRGPDSDDLVEAIEVLLAGAKGFRLERNASNLGFVGTCNRAALELETAGNDLLFLNSDTETTPGFVEELAGVLASSPQHGAVCARSDNATIASLPYALRDPSRGRSTERTREIFSAVRDVLPRFSVAPVAMGFCFLVRRELVERFGLFDEIYSPGYGEENDFCLRIGAAGFESVIAHRALVFHDGGLSFGDRRRAALRSAHEKILVKRFPEYPVAVVNYLYRDRDPIDVFADTVSPGDKIARVLIDLDWRGRGPTERQRGLLRALASEPSTRSAEFTIAVPDRAVNTVRRSFPGLAVRRAGELSGVWDVAYADPGDRPVPVARLNRCAPRWVLESNAPAETLSFADSIAPTSGTVAALVHVLSTTGARTPIDVERLRSRWATVTATPDPARGGSVPGQRLVLRILRAIDRRLPGRVVGIGRRMLSPRREG